MPISAYMKEIAGSLRKAAAERQREASDLRSQISIKESEMKSAISQIESRIQRSKVDVIEDHQQSSTVVANAASITHMKQQIKDTERDFNQYRAEIEQAISAKERDVNMLNQEASSFESRAAND